MESVSFSFYINKKTTFASMSDLAQTVTRPPGSYFIYSQATVHDGGSIHCEQSHSHAKCKNG